MFVKLKSMNEENMLVSLVTAFREMFWSNRIASRIPNNYI